MALPTEMSALITTLRDDGTHIDFACKKKPVPEISDPLEVIVRVEAAPLNPSDMVVMFGQAKFLEAKQTSPGVLSAAIDPEHREGMKKTAYGNPREGDMGAGNEGSGVVVAAGSDPQAQALVGKVVATLNRGSMYAEYCKVKVGESMMVMADGVTPAQAASSFVNPMTALGFVHQMKEDGHTGLVHTAAASQLGQMLTRICLKDGIPLVHVVRRPEQEEILRSIHKEAIIISQKSPTFVQDLAAAMKNANATLCFDATSGGSLSAQVLEAFDSVGLTRPGVQVYNYGILDSSPSTMTTEQKARTTFWLLPRWQATHQDGWKAHMERVTQNILTTFATSYTAEVGLTEAVTEKAIQVYGRQETGKKYLINPSKNVGSKPEAKAKAQTSSWGSFFASMCSGKKGVNAPA